jgi:hypothetical protein
MAEKPILFSGDMVRAIMDGRKTQTRRVSGLDRFNKQPGRWRLEGNMMAFDGGFDYVELPKSPYGRPGDCLWVRETWATVNSYDTLPPSKIPHGGKSWPVVWYDADPGAAGLSNTKSPHLGKKRPSIFMPRWASRLTLRVTDVRVERLQDITEEDARAEGSGYSVEDSRGNVWDARSIGREGSYITGFKCLWDSINAKRGYAWDSNRYVWVVEFERN